MTAPTGRGAPRPFLLATDEATLRSRTSTALLLVVGLLARLATVPLIVDMVLALALTKIPILWGGSADKPSARGFWDFAHEARTGYTMLLTLVAVLLAGAGAWSVDARRARASGHTRDRRRPAGASARYIKPA
jgi:uncharacterized membrane protein YphA (DoxX/SURF4 family)